jgi:hypothetical protein
MDLNVPPPGAAGLDQVPLRALFRPGIIWAGLIKEVFNPVQRFGAVNEVGSHLAEGIRTNVKQVVEYQAMAGALASLADPS